MVVRALFVLLFALAFAPAPSAAEEVVLGLSKDRVAITARFDGSDILIFGAVKREAALQEDPLRVVVTIAGPSEPVVVRRKDRKLGIWVNAAAVEVDAAPSFYAVATSAPWADSLSEVEDLRHKVSIPRAIRSVGAPAEAGNSQDFTDALIRIRQANGLYQVAENAVDFREQTLFSTSVRMPSNLTEGSYVTRIFLTRGGTVVSEYETTIEVDKVGLERLLFTMSRQQPLAYGLMSIAIAVLAGWAASTAFRLMRQG